MMFLKWLDNPADSLKRGRDKAVQEQHVFGSLAGRGCVELNRLKAKGSFRE